MSFQGFVQIEGSLPLVLLVTNSSGSPVYADALPSYRIYGPSGLMANGIGTAGLLDSKVITAATAAAPIVVTSAAHGLATGDRVSIPTNGGLTGLNGSFTITKVDADHFSLNGSSGSGTYLGGSSWAVTGLYGVTITCSAADGYEVGETYSALFAATVAAAPWGETHSFGVV